MMSSDERRVVTFESAPLILINLEIVLVSIGQSRRSATRPTPDIQRDSGRSREPPVVRQLREVVAGWVADRELSLESVPSGPIIAGSLVPWTRGAWFTRTLATLIYSL